MLYNQYSKIDLGETAVIFGANYKRDDSFNGNGKKFKYVPCNEQPAELLAKIEAEKVEAKRIDDLYFACTDTRELIKLINRNCGGKISGSSRTTSSIYSNLHCGLRVRVSRHDVYCKRSESDINVTFEGNNIYVNNEVVSFRNLTTKEEVFNTIIELVKSEVSKLA